MAACRRTVAAISENCPNAVVATYLRDRYTLFEHNLVARLAPTVQLRGRRVEAVSATDITVEDEPGSVVAQFHLGETRVDARLTPLLVGEEEAFEGAVCYEIGTSPPTPISVAVETGTIYFDLNSVFKGEGLPPPAWAAEMLGPQQPQVAAYSPTTIDSIGDVVWFRGGEDGFAVALVTDGVIATEPTLEVSYATGAGRLVVGFAGEPARAAAIASVDVDGALFEVTERYDGLLANRIETPDATLDAAFRAAVYNLEYTWIPPYGWVECVHHWSALWHMQHTAGAEWLGQVDRARRCTLEHGDRLLFGGVATNSAAADVGVPTRLAPDRPLRGHAIPQLTPGGHDHRDFGGSDQFWAWQVDHHWRFTADRKFAEQVADRLDEVLAHALAAADADGDGLLSWGFQIGNQEDYITTPGAGTTPTIEGIAMCSTRARLATALGDAAGADRWEARAATMTTRLKDRLWLADLGRFAYFAEQGGHRRLDGQYHTYLYPVIHRLVDPLAAYTSVRHVRDRFTGPDDEVYCSNNFPSHPTGTWGMQAGAAQQPWAARALADVGRWNEAWRPLAAVAKWVMNDNHRGSWPEVATEATPAYFSPPAALFVAAVCEAVFGLQVDRPQRRVEIAPAFPDHWPSARLSSGGFTAEYRIDGDCREYTIFSADPLSHTLRWALPVGSPRRVLVNGRPAKHRIEPGVGHVVLVVESRRSRHTTFTVEWQPAPVEIEHRPWVAEGDDLSVTATGMHVEAVDDPCGVVDRVELGESGVVLRIRRRLLAPYAGYGPLGRMLFARRTVFLRCRTPDGIAFQHPVDVTVVPPLELAASDDGDDGQVSLVVRNNADRRLRGSAWLEIASESIPLRVDVPARSERAQNVLLPPSMRARLQPGLNIASIVVPDLGAAFNAELRCHRGVDPSRATRHAVALELPDDAFEPDHQFTSWRRFPTHHHPPWWNAKSPLQALAGRQTLTMPGLLGITFPIRDQQVVPVSLATRPRLELDLPSGDVSKVIFIVVPLLDNHDMFAVVGRASLLGGGAELVSRELYFPGDLDWWYPSSEVGEFATTATDRLGGLPLLPALGQDGDWPDAHPPVFPSPQWWSRSPALATEGAVLCAVEVVPPRPLAAERVVLETIGEQAAFGVVAAVALIDDKQPVEEA